MGIVDEYIDYMYVIRRRSERTAQIYREAVEGFLEWCGIGCGDASGLVSGGAQETVPQEFASTEDSHLVDWNKVLTVRIIRGWRLWMLTEAKYSARTVNQHLSALSGFCRYLFHRGILAENPFGLLDRNGRNAVEGARLRDESEKRIAFFPDEALEKYFAETSDCADGTLLELYDDGQEHKDVYDRICRRMIISFLYGTALRRAELISLKISAVDFGRNILTVKGKGGKTRQVALTGPLEKELLNYMKAVERMVPSADRSGEGSLFVTFSGAPLYPVYVDRAVKTELGGRTGFHGHKSPHVLRHSLATELLKEGADIYSVGRFLGHSSIAATQIYTHGDIHRLKEVYSRSFPRAEKK